jgi:hypothetical protein
VHDELEAVQSENARLRAAVAQLSSQASDGARREQVLWSDLQETRIQLQQTGAQFASSDPRRIEARARELEELRTERDRLAVSQQGWQDQLDAARVQLETKLQFFQKEADGLRHQLESRGRERDAALHQLESLGRERDAALEQLESLVQERNRLAALRAEESQQHGKCLAALRHDLELARALVGARRHDAAAAESARADLEHRLVEVDDRLRAEIETSNRLDSEARAARAQLALFQHATDQSHAFAGDLEAARLRIEQLAADLCQARTANEQLRAVLNIFGLADHLESRPGPVAIRAAPNSLR